MNQYYEDSLRTRDACTDFFDALLELHSATCRRERLGDATKSEWHAVMQRVFAATQVALSAAAINPTDDVAAAEYFAKQATLRELRTGKTLRQEALDAVLETEIRR
jgi:hypothetical protein